MKVNCPVFKSLTEVVISLNSSWWIILLTPEMAACRWRLSENSLPHRIESCRFLIQFSFDTNWLLWDRHLDIHTRRNRVSIDWKGILNPNICSRRMSQLSFGRLTHLLCVTSVLAILTSLHPTEAVSSILLVVIMIIIQKPGEMKLAELHSFYLALSPDGLILSSS